jgi:hypothetical protein
MSISVDVISADVEKRMSISLDAEKRMSRNAYR